MNCKCSDVEQTFNLTRITLILICLCLITLLIWNNVLSLETALCQILIVVSVRLVFEYVRRSCFSNSRLFRKDKKSGKYILLDLSVNSLPFPYLLLNILLSPFAKCMWPLDKKSLMNKAQTQTGLSDFGNEDEFMPGLDLVIECVNGDENDFHALSRYAVHMQIVELLSSKLQMAALLTAHPEILEEPIRKPLIIASLFRTGTTHLHRLLAETGKFKFIKYYETKYPFIWPPLSTYSRNNDQRLEKGKNFLKFINGAVPLFQLMHNITRADQPEEETLLFNVHFQSVLISICFKSKSFFKLFMNNEKISKMKFQNFKKILQILQWQRRQQNGDSEENLPWLLKNPLYYAHFSDIMKVFPDARIITLYRDPISSLKSISVMISLVKSLFERNPDASFTFNNYMLPLLRALLQSFIKYRGGCTTTNEYNVALVKDKSGQILDLDSSEFFNDNLHVIRRIFSFLGELDPQPSSDEIDETSLNRVKKYIDANPRKSSKTIEFSFSLLGINEEQVRKDNHDLFEKYNTLHKSLIQTESKGIVTRNFIQV